MPLALPRSASPAGARDGTRCASRPCRRWSRRWAHGPTGAGTSRLRWLLAAIAALAVALARPHVTTRVPVREASLVLVLDHSGSMDANDVQPTRLSAAEHAANTFVDQLPSSARVGVVAFSSAPDQVRRADDRSRRRAPSDRLADRLTARRRPATRCRSRSTSCTSATGDAHAAIVLLSDGAANAGQDPVTVAPARPPRTRSRSTPSRSAPPNGSLPNPDPFGPPIAVPPDPQLMQQIARTSHGRSFNAQDAGRLVSIYTRPGHVSWAPRPSRPTSRSRSPRLGWRCCSAPGSARCAGAAGFHSRLALRRGGSTQSS